MPKSVLVCHAKTPCPEVHEISVAVELDASGNLHLHYHLRGDLSAIKIPLPEIPSAVDGLWKKTCFEAFIALNQENKYKEFNFSPSGQFAAYAFTDYRKRNDWMPANTIGITVSKSDDLFELVALISACDLPAKNTIKDFSIGLSAVIELQDGSLSYWALHHPSKAPDFHHRDGFALTINQNEVIFL